MLLLLPFLVFLIVVSAVRGRRATSNFTAFGMVVMLGVIGLVTWARWKAGQPFKATYQWINIPTSFTGAQAFQGFGIDISIRADHAALAALAALTLVTLFAVLWHRGSGRQEGGPARLHALLALGLLGACGVVVSGDLAALVGWWGLTGVATYLLLAHRWGTEAAGRASRIGLALPLFGDLALVCGVAILYSRYGQLDLDKLTYTALRSGYDTGLKGLGVVALALALAAFVRGGLFPFTGWMTGTLNAPPAAVAWTQGTWSLLAVTLLAKSMPFFIAGGPPPLRVLAYATGGAAVAGALLALADNQLRRSLTWAASVPVALLMLGIFQPNALVPALAGALAVALARPAAAAAAGSVAAAMRSGDVADMGETWKRMRMTSLTLLVAGVALALAPAGKAAATAGWHSAWFMAVAMVLGGLALLRPYVAVAHLALRRRRAFEPTRVREVLPLLGWSGVAAAALGLLAALAALAGPWASFLRGSAPPAVAPPTVLLWAGLGLLGAAIAFGLGLGRGRATVALSGRAQSVLARWVAVGVLAGDRYLRRAGLRVVEAVEGRWITGGESGLGRELAEAGAGELGARGLAAGALAVALVVVVAVAVAGALLAPGVAR